MCIIDLVKGTAAVKLLTNQPWQRTSKKYQHLSGCPVPTIHYLQTKGHADLFCRELLDTDHLSICSTSLPFILTLSLLASAQSAATALTLTDFEFVIPQICKQ